ncbi:MAG: LPS assembly lipoprotein LptE [Desulfovibrionaceae bacterium]|nr:LPS assembly lipoprotein LptE [Desulfovibrionaceae bacterium]
MKNARCLIVFCTLISLLLLSGCGPSNSVRLLPLKPAAGVLPAPSSSTISVVQFADKRQDTSSIGLRRDNSYFTTLDSATRWLSTAIADNLSARGYQVTYAGSASEAIKGSPDYILTGSLESLDVREKSATSFEVSLRVKYVLSNREKRVVLETLTANQTRTSFPTNSAVEGLLKDTLQDIVGPMTDKVAGTVGQ